VVATCRVLVYDFAWPGYEAYRVALLFGKTEVLQIVCFSAVSDKQSPNHWGRLTSARLVDENDASSTNVHSFGDTGIFKLRTSSL
jgi:hypothetical protein